MNFGITFSGYWCGPYTLLPRVMITGSLNDDQYDLTMFSAAAFVAAYGLVGSSTSPSRRDGSSSYDEPYTSSVETWMKRLIPHDLAVSTSTCVPITLFSVNANDCRTSCRRASAPPRG